MGRNEDGGLWWWWGGSYLNKSGWCEQEDAWSHSVCVCVCVCGFVTGEGGGGGYLVKPAGGYLNITEEREFPSQADANGSPLH